MARSTDSIGAPNVLASSRAPAQAGIEIIDVNSTDNVLIGKPFGFPESYVAIRVPYTEEFGGTDFAAHRRAWPSAYQAKASHPLMHRSSTRSSRRQFQASSLV